MDPVAAALSAVEDRVVDDATVALRRSSRARYLGGDSRHELLRLFQELVAGIDADDPAVVSDYVERIAERRRRAGSDMSEVQAAFAALEESMWAHAVLVVEGDKRVDAIEAISTALRAGRDALVRTYVSVARAVTVAGEPAEPDERSDLLTVEVRNRVGLLTMCDHRKLNALGAGMVSEILAALDGFEAEDVRAVVIRAAAGMPVWSCGHDIAELPRGRRDPLGYGDPLEQCVRALRSYPHPVVAMVRGSVWGGAFDLVLSCDVVVADDSATFAITPANLGLPYNTTGLLHFIGRVPANVVKEMFFTAKPIDARQAERWMVVNHLVGAEELEAFTTGMAETMADKAPLAVAAVKEQLRVLSDYQPVAAQVYERVQDLRRQAYDSQGYLEGLAAFDEKRRPHFRGE